MRNLLLSFATALAAGAFVASAPTPAAATPLVLEMSGTLAPGTGFDGTPFGTTLGFTLSASFDSASGALITDGIYQFATGASLTIAGEGTVTTAAGAATIVLADPSVYGHYVAGVANPTLEVGVLGLYSTATPIFFAADPTATMFSNLLLLDQIAGDFTLTNGHVLTNFLADSLTSDSIAGVPEPASLALLAIGLAGIMVSRRRKHA